MIDLRERPEAGWNVLLAISILGIALATWFAFFAPKPVPLSTKQALSSVLQTTDSIKQANVAAEKAVADRTWDMSSEALGSEMLGTLNRLATARNLQLSGFHTNKTIDLAAIREASYQATVDGTFPDLLAFMKEVDDPASKLVLSGLRLSAIDAGSDKVTANITVVGFLRANEPEGVGPARRSSGEGGGEVPKTIARRPASAAPPARRSRP